MSHMFFFGFGYVASFLAKRLREEGWEMAGTTRTNDKVNAMWEQGVEPHIWDGETPLEAPMRVLKGRTHILHSIPPVQGSDRVMKLHQKLLITLAPQLSWYGYISTVSVYGDTLGNWANEDYEPNPSLRSGKTRLRIERTLLRLKKRNNLPVNIFRSGAIYGPSRSALRRAATGKAQIIHKEGLHISRIHVQDLAEILFASMKNPSPGVIYNAVDDLPCGPEIPLELAYDMIGQPRPPTLQYEDVKDELPKSLNSYYLEDRQISNQRIKSELGVKLKYPTYKEGYEALDHARKIRMVGSD